MTQQGALRPGTSDTIIAPLLRTGRPPCPYGHGAGNNPTELLGSGGVPTIRPLMSGVADLGHAVGCYEHAQDWANDADLAAALSIVAFLQSAFGASGGKFPAAGSSMGAATMLRLSLVYPNLVSCGVLMIPALNLPVLAATDFSGARAPIYSAWGETFPNPLPAAADLLSFPVVVPLQVWGASNDGFSVGVPEWAAANADLVEYHDLGPVGHDPAGVDRDAVRTFILSHTPAT